MAVNYSNHETVCGEVQIAVIRFVKSIAPPGSRLLVFTQWHGGIHLLCGRMIYDGKCVADSDFNVRCYRDHVLMIDPAYSVADGVSVLYSDPDLFDRIEGVMSRWHSRSQLIHGSDF